jgi:lysophospholipase L1-like esterase
LLYILSQENQANGIQLMRIAFFGDSLTEGLTGTAFLPLLEKRLPDCRLFNYGRGGDTIISLQRRIHRLAYSRAFDMTFLWVGVNDILARQSLSYSLLKLARCQPWARSEQTFRAHYKKCLSRLHPHAPRVVTIPPLLIGENLSSSWNLRMDRLSTIINEVSKRMEGAEFLDVRKGLFSHLPEQRGRDFQPKSALPILREKEPRFISSRKEGTGDQVPYVLTIDGVHLNRLGAELVAECFFNAIRDQGAI